MQTFCLNTKNLSYIFSVSKSGHLEHHHFGSRVDTVLDAESLKQSTDVLPGNTICYSSEHSYLTMENFCSELSTSGKGDTSIPFVDLSYGDGSSTCDFIYESHSYVDEPTLPKTSLPTSYDFSTCLKVTLHDAVHTDIKLVLTYKTYYDCDIIARSSTLLNLSQEPVTISNLSSMQLDLDDNTYNVSTFLGSWANEMNRTITPCTNTVIFGSRTGGSSNRVNPFFMLSRPETTEATGEAYAFNLIYSGNHREVIETRTYGRLRIQSGINPDTFSWILQPCDSFDSPEAVMSFSNDGFNGVSLNMHEFVRKHIVRGPWRDKARPVLINSWEASYFNFNESKLVSLAKKASSCGIELFVLDDGWFGKRNDDTSSLGDWYCNLKKLPQGLDGLAKKINKLNMKFGLWLEPEMISTNSELYTAHPDWALQIKDAPHSEGRNQRVLDLTNEEVCSYIINSISSILESANIEYVKWDMNRIFSDVYSTHLPRENQKEVPHRYILGLYSILGALQDKYPDILFEACASGGNRTDLGMLCYMQQVWISDNTDPSCRFDIQLGASYGYPTSVMGCHVSASPNHQTLRKTSLDTRYNIAFCGLLGYELNLCDMSSKELDEIKEQVSQYKAARQWMFSSKFYRLISHGTDIKYYLCVSEDKKHAVCTSFRRYSSPRIQTGKLKLVYLDDSLSYSVRNIPHKIDIRDFGGLINTALPVHIKEGGLVHSLASKIVKYEEEKLDFTATGQQLNNLGILFPQPFSGSGYNSTVAYMNDFSSRLYFIDSI